MGALDSSLLLAAQFLSNALLSLKGRGGRRGHWIKTISPCLQKKIQGQTVLGRVRVGWETAGYTQTISDCLKGDSWDKR